GRLAEANRQERGIQSARAPKMLSRAIAPAAIARGLHVCAGSAMARSRADTAAASGRRFGSLWSIAIASAANSGGIAAGASAGRSGVPAEIADAVSSADSG